jgi:hypothetical protein
MSEFSLFFTRSRIGIDKNLKATVTRGSSTPRFAIGKEGFIITVLRLKIDPEL